MIKTLKIVITIEIFILGLFVGYGIFVLHWFSDYVASEIPKPQEVQVTNITSEGGYICYTMTSINQSVKTGNKTICKKQ